MGLIPDEGKSLPPPGIINRNSVWLAGLGWCSAMLHNGLSYRPPLRSGIHRQALLVTIGWFLGYHITKIENYTYAKLDRDMNVYMEYQTDEHSAKEKKTFAEIVEPFHPAR